MELLEALLIAFIALLAFLAFYLHLVYRPENKTPTSQLKDVVTPSLQLDELPAALTPVQRSPAAAPQPLQSPPAPLQLNPATASPPTGRTQYSISPPPPSTSPIFYRTVECASATNAAHVSAQSARAAAAEAAAIAAAFADGNPSTLHLSRQPALAGLRASLTASSSSSESTANGSGDSDKLSASEHGSEQGSEQGNIKDGSSAVAVVEAQPQPNPPRSPGVSATTQVTATPSTPDAAALARAAIDAEALYHAEATKAVKGMITTASLLKQEEEAEAAAELAAAAAKLQAVRRGSAGRAEAIKMREAKVIEAAKAEEAKKAAEAAAELEAAAEASLAAATAAEKKAATISPAVSEGSQSSQAPASAPASGWAKTGRAQQASQRKYSRDIKRKPSAPSSAPIGPPKRKVSIDLKEVVGPINAPSTEPGGSESRRGSYQSVDSDTSYRGAENKVMRRRAAMSASVSAGAESKNGTKIGKAIGKDGVQLPDGRRPSEDLEEARKATQARSFLTRVFESSTLFAGASAEAREELVKSMREVQTSEGEYLIHEGDKGEHFFVVRSGVYAVLLKEKGDKPVFHYRAGGSFGELALLYNQPRKASIRCENAGVVYALDRGTFRNVLRNTTEKADELALRLVRKVNALEGLTNGQLRALVSIMQEEQYTDGQIVCEQGSPMDSLYIVKQGLVHQTTRGSSTGPSPVTSPGNSAHGANELGSSPAMQGGRQRVSLGGQRRANRESLATLQLEKRRRESLHRRDSKDPDGRSPLGRQAMLPYQAGESFGGASLQEADPRNLPTWPGMITSCGTVTLLRLKRQVFIDVLGELSTLLTHNFQQKVLGEIEFFKALRYVQRLLPALHT